MNNERLIIYTDGSSLGNPGPGGYGAVIVSPKLQEVIELGGNKPLTTNNEMEMSAVVSALAHIAINNMPVTIYTDSKFVINGITKWVKNWQKNGWVTSNKQPVTHRAIWEQMVSLVDGRGTVGTVTWQYVPGHQGVPGNERVDDIARWFAEGKSVELYRGNLDGYTLDILAEPSIQNKKDKTFSESGYPKYLSLIAGELQTHTTWSECENRVKGKPARFKKVKNSSEEKSILESWGIIKS